MLTLDQFSYDLPPELIAQSPAVPRDSSRLLVLDRNSGQILHHHFYDLPRLLTDNDVLVRNNTKVLPARLYGKKETGGHVEVLLVQRKEILANSETWEVMTKPGLKLGQKVIFNAKLQGICRKVEDFTRFVEFDKKGEELFETFYAIGHMPIPPYIHWNEDDEQSLREKYQTTYAKIEGSVAAPTAGLHFTPELDQRLGEKGVQIEEVTLHVGLGTFLPVKERDIEQHHMHTERFEVSNEVAGRLNRAKAEGKRLVAVGTTTTRVLESIVNSSGKLSAESGETDIYIYPPYRFTFVDALITNFHLPKSTLLMMVSAFVSSPNTDQKFTNFLESSIGKAYQVAIENDNRFYSFGDAMLVV